MNRNSTKLIISLTLALVASGLFSCDEFLEKDISEKSVDMLAPADNAVALEGAVSFWWNPVEGATGYDLQLVQPDFDESVNLVADTVVAGNSFTLELEAGSYQWRVCALNSAYQSQFTTFSLVVKSATDISGAAVSLLTPANAVETSTKTISFSWESVNSADTYVFELVSPDFENAGTLVSQQELESTSATLTLSAGNYQWRVKAVNENSQTEYTVRSLTITP